MLSKTVASFTGQLVTVETVIPISNVLARLDNELNRAQSGKIFNILQSSSTRQEIESKVKEILGESDFLYFSSASHSRWLNAYFEHEDTPGAYMYTIGNPLIAQGILQHDVCAGLSIPPRLLVTEGEKRTGTKILYHLPSSVMALNDNLYLREAAEALDRKLERFVITIASETDERHPPRSIDQDQSLA